MLTSSGAVEPDRSSDRQDLGRSRYRHTALVYLLDYFVGNSPIDLATQRA